MTQPYERAAIGMKEPVSRGATNSGGRLCEAGQVLSGGRVVDSILPDTNSERLLHTIEDAFGIHTPSRRDADADIIEAKVRLASGTCVTEVHILADASAVLRRGELRDGEFVQTSDSVAIERIHDVAETQIDGEAVVVASVQPLFRVPSTLTIHRDGQYSISPN